MSATMKAVTKRTSRTSIYKPISKAPTLTNVHITAIGRAAIRVFSLQLVLRDTRRHIKAMRDSVA
jgi:hypothetical protein